MQVSAVLQRNGIDLEADIEKFWDLCAAGMKSAEEKLICAAICSELKKKYFVLFVQSMLTLPREEMEAVIKRCGGVSEWIPGIEDVLGHRFKSVSMNAPLSAHLVDEVAAPNDQALPSKAESGDDKDRDDAEVGEASRRRGKRLAQPAFDE